MDNKKELVLEDSKVKIYKTTHKEISVNKGVYSYEVIQKDNEDGTADKD